MTTFHRVIKTPEKASSVPEKVLVLERMARDGSLFSSFLGITGAELVLLPIVLAL